MSGSYGRASVWTERDPSIACGTCSKADCQTCLGDNRLQSWFKYWLQKAALTYAGHLIWVAIQLSQGFDKALSAT